MHAYGSGNNDARTRKSTSPSQELRVAVTFPRPAGGPGLTKFDAPLSINAVSQFVPDPVTADRAIYELKKRGFTLTQRSRLSASMRCTKEVFERVFGTNLDVVNLDQKQHYAFHSFYFPPSGAKWGVFSGTSAAAPQLAGVCALLLEKNPNLTASDIKAILRRTARDVLAGHANPASSDDLQSPLPASPGDDGATGAGLVDAFAAWQQL